MPKKDEIFSKTPAQILWTDYIHGTDDKEFSYDIKLDENQDTRDSQIKIDFYEASERKRLCIKTRLYKNYAFC